MKFHQKLLKNDSEYFSLNFLFSEGRKIKKTPQNTSIAKEKLFHHKRPWRSYKQLSSIISNPDLFSNG